MRTLPPPSPLPFVLTRRLLPLTSPASVEAALGRPRRRRRRRDVDARERERRLVVRGIERVVVRLGPEGRGLRAEVPPRRKEKKTPARTGEAASSAISTCARRVDVAKRSHAGGTLAVVPEDTLPGSDIARRMAEELLVSDASERMAWDFSETRRRMLFCDSETAPTALDPYAGARGRGGGERRDDAGGAPRRRGA